MYICMGVFQRIAVVLYIHAVKVRMANVIINYWTGSRIH